MLAQLLDLLGSIFEAHVDRHCLLVDQIGCGSFGVDVMSSSSRVDRVPFVRLMPRRMATVTSHRPSGSDGEKASVQVSSRSGDGRLQRAYLVRS